MSRVPVIAIDGPSGVGKGTVARRLSRELGWHFLDSGAIYRSLALAAQRAGVASDREADLARLGQTLDVHFGEGAGDEKVTLSGVDVTRELRLEETGAMASAIAKWPQVRQAVLQRQRDFRQAPGLVADGRDMGTVVFTDALAKVFLDASPEERARRRLNQLREAGREATLAPLLADIRARDERDRTRSTAPLRPAEDAQVIDTTSLSPDQVFSRVLELVRARQ